MIPAIDLDAALGQAIGGAAVTLLAFVALVAIWAWGVIRDRRR